ncbi:GNAT family N-acetyltransferase [Sediminibacillus albus]|uniref:Acetyltransferase (GNAT) domain-containing protein n=1 Tax=Sediminibacillus albus TaxID=407036 RepID=A0A1G8VUG6_9BACI|nr:GNAT family N-acetyltransferase [Sediminibacillus albus]SDJ69682.1 Acetyltransferase (GNAT) domain-containing protein [Sediminibacillus albus]
MELRLRNGTLLCRKYQMSDFYHIQKLNREENWNSLVWNEKKTRDAWNNSHVAYVVFDGDIMAGYVRGLTDTAVTLYICELLIARPYRRLGAGTELLNYVHQQFPDTRMEMLASSNSEQYYHQLGFRPFYGFRKTLEE